VPVRGSDEREGTLGAGDLNPQKARVLLMLALTKSADPPEIARIFEANQ
jgi:L-asparaginase